MSIIYHAVVSLSDAVTSNLAAAPPTTTITTGGVSSWLKDNAVPLLVLFIGLGILGAGRKGEASKVLLVTALTFVGLGVIAVGLDATTGIGIGKWLISLAGVHTS